MAKKNIESAITVSCIESSEFTEDFNRYYNIVNYLSEKWGEIFASKEAKHRPYIAALLKDGASEPEIHYFGRQSSVIRFVKEHPAAVARYRYYEEMEFLM